MPRVVLSLLFAALCSIAAAAPAPAGVWPSRSVRVIVASPVGSGDDVIVRLLTPKLQELLGQPFVVENHGGGGGVIGQKLARAAAPDGYTILLAGGSMAGARYANAQADYDVLRDFTPVSLVETSPFVVLVTPKAEARTLKEYVERARAAPGKTSFGTLGPGQMPYWTATLFNRMAGIRAREVRYKEITATEADLYNGEIDCFFSPFNVAIRNRTRLRLLGVTTAVRAPALPDVPTVAEAALPGYDVPAWRSIMGPAGMQREIVDRLNASLARALAMPDVRKNLLAIGSEPTPSAPDALRARYAEWIERFRQIAEQAGLKPQ